MNHRFCVPVVLAGLIALPISRAADPTAEELLKPTRLSLITAGNDLSPVLEQIEKQTGNKLVDRTRDRRDDEPLPEWNFSLSDREFWPLIDKFFDAANLEPLSNSSTEGLPIARRFPGLSPRYGKAVYIGPFRLEVTQVTSRLGTRLSGDHRASITLEVMWEPRLKPLAFTQSVRALEMIADGEVPVELDEHVREFNVEAGRDAHAVELHIPLKLPPQQLETISSLKGSIKALVATRSAEFRFDKLASGTSTQPSDGGVKVVLDQVRENQGLCEIHMRLEFDESLPAHVAEGSWNFQNLTYLEAASGERIDHAGFESTTQGGRSIGLAYFFDVPQEKLDEYTWVYHAPVAIVEVPIEYELKDIRLP